MRTKYGRAIITKHGYYEINSTKEGNFGKKLHRLIFEDFYQCKLPEDIVIHHEDGNKLNNEIWNLVPMTHAEHTVLHHKGSKHKKGVNKRISLRKNTTGYFRVIKKKEKTSQQGFTWRYQYSENGKQKSISSVDLAKLKDKVVKKGLEWEIISESVAKSTCSECGIDFVC